MAHVRWCEGRRELGSIGEIYLDAIILVAGVGVAVPARASVVHPELGEQPRLRHLAPDHPAGLGGVVQDERGGRPPDPLEHLAQPVAQALGALRQHRRAVAGVGVRQRDDEELRVQGPPADHAPEVAEVDLGGARRPDELQVSVAPGRRRMVPPPAGDEAADARVGPAVAALGDQPVVDPPGGVALLARRPEVGLEHRGDPIGVRVGGGMRPRLGHRRGGRHVLLVGVLGHGVARHGEPAGDLRPRHAHGVHLSYILSC
jgi:hypothetical protein